MKKRITNKKYHWNNFIYKLNQPSIMTSNLITKTINLFWSTHVENLNDKKHIITLFRGEQENSTYFTISNLIRLNKSDKDFYLKKIIESFAFKSNNYKDNLITKFIIGFGIRDGLATINKYRTLNPTKTFQKYKHYKLPVTMDPLKYGNNIMKAKHPDFIISITPLTTAIVISKENENLVEIFRSGILVLSYRDKMINENTFERIIGDNHYIYIKDGDTYKLDLFSVKKPSRKIKDIQPENKLNTKIITMDIETFVLPNGDMKPYLISWFDGETSKSYYLTNYPNHDTMLTIAIKDLMKYKYDGYKIYLHNFAKFDGIFLVKQLYKLGIISPVIHKGRIIELTMAFSNKQNSNSYSITFRDSLLLLLASLRNLAKCFGVEVQKSIFPHRFVNENNLDYIGNVPPFEFFDGITPSEYEDYCTNFNNNWSLKNESIKYCKIDCISLYQIMNKFIEMIFNLYKINLNKTPTLPSLAFTLFRTIQLSKVKAFIPMISGKIAKDIRLSYTGGSTDMFIPKNNHGELIYGYDVNSLYPYIMSTTLLPVGKPTYFEGNIRKYNPEAFGFFYCKVTTPNNLEHPILQNHIKTNSGFRTVSGLGTFEQMIFSPEMDNAIKFGYKFQILRGYTFKKSYIFTDFINYLYNIRTQYPKNHPMNYIHKIIMNSLYGKFGMDDRFTSSYIIDKKSYLQFEKDNLESIIDVKSLDDSYLVEIHSDDTRTMVDNGSETHNVNVAIASAITSYARIYMSQFKNNPKLKLFYTDTDSIYTNLNPDQMNELYPGIVSSKGIGNLKLESVSTSVIFLAPKLYYLKTIDGNEIIKVKGLDKNIPLTESDFNELLFKNKTITKTQDKWYRSLEQSTINIKKQLYTLKQTDNKRELIHDSNGQLIGTKPYFLNSNKIN